MLAADVFRLSLMGIAVLIMINLLLTAAMLGPAHGIFAIAMANRRAVSDYEEIFSAATCLPQSGPIRSAADGQDEFLRRIRGTMLSGDHSAVEGMRALRKVAAAGGLRQSAGTFLLYLPLQSCMQVQPSWISLMEMC